MKSNIALSSPAGWLRMSRAVRRPDGLWEPADVPEGADFLPFNGEWGYLVLRGSDRVLVARLEARGIAWERELPEIPGDTRRLQARVDPDGALRAGPWMISPDGEIAVSPLGWIPEAIPGPDGSWLTRDGVWMIPRARGAFRAAWWIAPGAGVRTQFMWAGREGILAYQDFHLVWIPKPGARPVVIGRLLLRPAVFPDGRWAGQDLQRPGRWILGQKNRVLARVKAPLSGILPLHEGFWGILESGGSGRPVWIRPGGRMVKLPPVSGSDAADRGAWRIWPGRSEEESPAPAVAIRRGGSPAYELPPLRPPILDGWALDAEGRLWRFPPNGQPHPVPASAPFSQLLQECGQECGGGVMAILPTRRGRQLAWVGEEGVRMVWALPPFREPIREDRVRIERHGDGSFVVLMPRRIGRLGPGWSAWAPAPEGRRMPGGLRILRIPGGLIVVPGFEAGAWILPGGSRAILPVRWM